MVTQVKDARSASHVVQAVWNKVREQRPDFLGLEVVLPMRQMAALWPQLFPAEQCRLVQLLIERIVLGDTRMEIIWRDSGWQELACELITGTIGAELAELEVRYDEDSNNRRAGLNAMVGRWGGETVDLHSAENQEAWRQQDDPAARNCGERRRGIAR